MGLKVPFPQLVSRVLSINSMLDPRRVAWTQIKAAFRTYSSNLAVSFCSVPGHRCQFTGGLAGTQQVVNAIISTVTQSNTAFKGICWYYKIKHIKQYYISNKYATVTHGYVHMLCSFCFSPLLATGFLNSDFGRHDPRFRSRINPQEPPTFGWSQLTSRRGFWKGFVGHCFRPGLKPSHSLRHTTSLVLRKLTRINIPSLQGKTFPFTRIHGCHSMIAVPVHRKNHGHVCSPVSWNVHSSRRWKFYGSEDAQAPQCSVAHGYQAHTKPTDHPDLQTRSSQGEWWQPNISPVHHLHVSHSSLQDEAMTRMGHMQLPMLVFPASSAKNAPLLGVAWPHERLSTKHCACRLSSRSRCAL